MLKKTTYLITFGLLPFYCMVSSCSRPEAEKASSRNSAEIDSVAVQIVTIREMPLEKEEKIESFLYANKDAFLTAKIDGIIKEVYVELGDEVKIGDTLAKIEDELLCLEYKLAQNLFEQIKQDFERSQALYEKKLISGSEYEQMNLKYKQAEIEQQLALERLRQSRIIAPFSGVILTNLAKIGQVVRTGDRDSLFHLTEIYPIYSRVYLNEEELTRLKTEGKVRIESRYSPKKSAWGRIIKKSPMVDPTSGAMELILQIDKEYLFLKPGMAVNIFLKNNAPSTTLTVPKTALLNLQNHSSEEPIPIFLCRNGRAIKRMAQLKEDLDSLWVIEGEFGVGDSVIAFSSSDLKDGQRVKVNRPEVPAGKK